MRCYECGGSIEKVHCKLPMAHVSINRSFVEGSILKCENCESSFLSFDTVEKLEKHE